MSSDHLWDLVWKKTREHKHYVDKCNGLSFTNSPELSYQMSQKCLQVQSLLVAITLENRLGNMHTNSTIQDWQSNREIAIPECRTSSIDQSYIGIGRLRSNQRRLASCLDKPNEVSKPQWHYALSIPKSSHFLCLLAIDVSVCVCAESARRYLMILRLETNSNDNAT